MTTSLPKMAFLSWYPTNSRVSGERVRAVSLLEEMRKYFEVDLVCVEEVAAHISSSKYEIRYRDYVRALMSGSPIEKSRLGHNAEIQTLITERLEQSNPNIILANQPWVWPLIPESYQGRSVLDTQNVNSERLLRMAQSWPWWDARSPILKWVARQNRHLEKEYCLRAARVWAVSEEDRMALIAHTDDDSRVLTVPNGAQVLSESPMQASRFSGEGDRKLLFFGSLSYEANRDGLRRMRKWVEGAPLDGWSLTIAGSGPRQEADRLFADVPQVRVVGEVESAYRTFLEHDILIIPLKQGGGSRLKVVEAASCGCVLASTSIGVEGYAMVSGEHYIPLENREDLLGLLTLPPSADQLMNVATSAYALAKTYDWVEIVAKQAADLYMVAGE